MLSPDAAANWLTYDLLCHIARLLDLQDQLIFTCASRGVHNVVQPLIYNEIDTSRLVLSSCDRLSQTLEERSEYANAVRVLSCSVGSNRYSTVAREGLDSGDGKLLTNLTITENCKEVTTLKLMVVFQWDSRMQFLWRVKALLEAWNTKKTYHRLKRWIETHPIDSLVSASDAEEEDGVAHVIRQISPPELTLCILSELHPDDLPRLESISRPVLLARNIIVGRPVETLDINMDAFDLVMLERPDTRGPYLSPLRCGSTASIRRLGLECSVIEVPLVSQCMGAIIESPPTVEVVQIRCHDIEPATLISWINARSCLRSLRVMIRTSALSPLLDEGAPGYVDVKTQWKSEIQCLEEFSIFHESSQVTVAHDLTSDVEPRIMGLLSAPDLGTE